MVSSGRAIAVAASFALCILIASAMAMAASSPGVEWEKTYDVHGNDQGGSMQQASDGGYIMAGSSGSLVCLAKINPDGSLQWKNTYGFGDGAKGYSVAQASDGGYVATGSVRQGGKDKVLLMKVDQNGTQLWNKTYGDSDAESIEGAGTSVRRASGGYVIAAQYPYPTLNSCGLYLIMTDDNGNMVRNIMLGRSGDITSPSVEQTGDGGFIIAATIHTKGYQGHEPDYDIYLVKFNPSGATQWEKTIGGSGSQYCGRDGSVRQAKDGGYVIAGENGSAYLAKTDSSGNLLWGKQYNNSDRACSVALADDGGYVLAGTDGAGRPVIIKTSSSGDEEWRETAGVAGEGTTVQKESDGGYAMSGTSSGDLCLMKLKAPVKKSSSLFMNGFSGFGDPFGQGSSVDEGQVGGSLFSSMGLKPLNFGGYSPARSTANINSPFSFSSMPSPGITGSGYRFDFPKMAASFGDGGWPFS
ncbi:MAG TPA: hypothetical protein VMC61_04735 [Methanocella sp.]|nr:hypothetical protein [Methanocella sp.]